MGSMVGFEMAEEETRKLVAEVRRKVDQQTVAAAMGSEEV